MDKTTLDSLSEINDSLFEHVKWLLEKRDLDALSRLIPVVDTFTHLLIEMGERRQ